MTKFDTLKCQNENTRNRASGDTKPWKQRRGRPRPSSSCFRLPDPLLRTHTEKRPKTVASSAAFSHCTIPCSSLLHH